MNCGKCGKSWPRYTGATPRHHLNHRRCPGSGLPLVAWADYAPKASTNSLLVLQARIRTINKDHGWDDPPPDFPTAIALLHSELSEALEEWRVPEIGTSDYYSPTGKPCGVPSEFADTLIRLLHYSYVFQIDIVDAVNQKLAYNETRPWRHGGKQI